MSGALVAVSILSAACGADPDLQSKSQPQQLESRAPNPSLPLEPRWQAEATRRLSTAFWWRSAERYVYAGTLRWAVAADSARTRSHKEIPLSSAGPTLATPSTGRAVWDRLASCESGGDWAANTGNGYYGGLQWLPSTWWAYGGQGMPHHASREAQIAVAERVLAAAGGRFTDWPGCRRKLNLP